MRFKASGERFLLLFLVVFVLSSLLSCGKKGPPMPPESFVPKVVGNLTIEGRGQGFILSWDMPDKNTDGTKLTDLAGFKIYRKRGDGGDDFPVYMDISLDRSEGFNVDGRRISFADTELENGQTYYYRIAPYNSSGYFGDFSETLKGLWAKTPGPPVNIKGEASDKSVRLTWEPPDEERDYGFRVFRRKADEEYPARPVNSEIIRAGSYTDIGVSNNTQYFYTLKSVIEAEGTRIEGQPSAELMFVPIDLIPPAIPERLSAVAGTDRISLYWDENGDYDILGYNIYRKKTNSRESTKLNSEPVAENRYVDDKVDEGAAYQYYVTSVDNSPQRNESPASMKVSARVHK